MARRGHDVTGIADQDAVDEARWLQALEREWGRIFLIKPSGGRWYANRLDGTGDAIITATPGELNAALHAAWTAR